MSLVLDGSLGVTFPASNSPSFTNYQGGSITSGTAVASTSGTSIDFTGIPSWVKRITVLFNGVSTNGSSNIIIQSGNGSVETSGYLSTMAYAVGTSVGAGTFATTGFMAALVSAATTSSGIITLTSLGSNTWVHSSVIAQTNSANTAGIAGGNKTFSGVIDRVRITTVNGTDTFDAGSINIIYE